MTTCQRIEIDIIKNLISKDGYEIKKINIEDNFAFVSLSGEIGLAEDENNLLFKYIYRKSFHIIINQKGQPYYFDWETGNPIMKPFHNTTILEGI